MNRRQFLGLGSFSSAGAALVGCAYCGRLNEGHAPCAGCGAPQRIPLTGQYVLYSPQRLDDEIVRAIKAQWERARATPGSLIVLEGGMRLERL